MIRTGGRNSSSESYQYELEERPNPRDMKSELLKDTEQKSRGAMPSNTRVTTALKVVLLLLVTVSARCSGQLVYRPSTVVIRTVSA